MGSETLVRPLVLSGSYELTIDDKNRMLVPSEVRKQFLPARDGEGFYCLLAVDGRPWLYPEVHYEDLISRQETELTPDEDSLDYYRMNLSMASKIEWDKQGRILIPEKYLAPSGVGRNVVLNGVKDHLEIWSRADWTEKTAALNARRAEIALKHRAAKQNPTPPLS